MSHLALWNLAIERGENITVAEDDAIFNLNFENRAVALMEQLPVGWDFILWGWNFNKSLCFEMLPGVSPCLGRFDLEKMRSSTGTFQSQLIAPSLFKLLWAVGIPAYTISPNGARLIKSKLLPLRPVMVPHPDVENPSQVSASGIDMALNTIYRDLDAFVCFPPVVITKNNAATSTISVSESSLSIVNRAVKADPNDVAALKNMGVILHGLKRLQEAIATFDRVLAIQPGEATALRNRGFILLEQQRFEEALASHDRLLSTLPPDVEALHRRGLALHHLNRLGEALANYEHALVVQPEHAPSLRDRGIILFGQQRFEEALTSFDRLLSLDPRDIEALHNRGVVLHGLKRFEEALANYEQALVIQPGHPPTLRNRALLLEQQRFEEA